jgi:hypothetical protein
MDYYGVGTGKILGLIDLDSIHVELAFHERRSAELCMKTIRDQVIMRHGRMDHLRSDHAREFIGLIMTHF